MTDASSTLVLGGARSGKSTYAEGLAAGHAGPLVYIATAEAYDGEMTSRIAAHVARRGEAWQTIEAPIALTDTIAEAGRPGHFLLVDCLTLWLTNLILGEHNVADHTGRLLEAIAACEARLVLVSNEVGLGIVPENALARRFRDEAGILNQSVAAAANHVVLVSAGLPLTLK
ncbi:MAG: bifunctional adenosylcobinamide kinase/adenosylcobinamide-phosphate guanylyltransferase [Pseudomonadota bacterium]